MKRFEMISGKALSLVGWAALAVCTSSANAQVQQAGSDRSAAATSDTNTLEKVVVTATKREAVLTDVSMGVSALSEKALEARGVKALEDLGAVSLGMNIVKAAPGENLLVSRGISTAQSFSLQSGPAVGVYIDEMPLTGIATGVPDFGLWDVARVEMLRGPQGTLYGEGAMAGTIRVISNSPDATRLSGRVQLSGVSVSGGGTGSGARAMLNVPLSEGVAAVRATVGYNKDAGWIDAPELGLKDINTGEQREARVAVRAKPSSALTIDASIWYQDNSNVANANQTSPGIYAPTQLGVGAAPIPRLGSDSRHNAMANVTVNYDAGAFSVVSATSHSKQGMNTNYETSESGPFFFGKAGTGSSLVNAREREVTMTSQEFRLVSNDAGAVNWTAGAYLKKLDRRADNVWDIQVPLLALNDRSLVISQTGSKSKAVFGEVDWTFTKSLTLTGGLRRYTDDRQATANVTNFSPVFQVPVGVTGPVTVNESQTTYNAVLSWKPHSGLNVFARAASGFRAGGPNFWAQDPANIPKDFKAEKIDSLEVGVKSNPVSWLVLNAYAFSNTWKDKQVVLTTPTGQFDYVSNASEAKSTGAELELQAYPIKGLMVSAAATYTDAKLSSDVLSSTNNIVAKSGNKLPYVSPWELKTSIDYRWPLGNGLLASVNAAYTYRGANYSEISNSAATDNGLFHFATLRAGVESRDVWSAAVSVKNLGNSKSITTIQQSASGALRYPTYIQPRTVGLDIQVWY